MNATETAVMLHHCAVNECAIHFIYANGFVLFALQFDSKLLKLVFVFFHLCCKIHQVVEASKRTSGNYVTLEPVKILVDLKCNFHFDEKRFSVSNRK